MVDLHVLENHGLTTDVLRKKFTATDKDEKTKSLINLIRSRINEGITANLKSWRVYWAIDLAYDAPFMQTTPTLVKHILSSNLDDAGVLKAVEEFGLTHLMRSSIHPDGTTKKIVDLPAFFGITIPIAKAYATIRAAKIFNDRSIFPLFKFEPSQLTMKNRIRCEIITDRIQKMVSQYGLTAVMRQADLSTIIYGINMQFPAEAWHVEKQIHEGEDGKEEEKIIREGLRYNLPHPSRVFFDRNYRASTFNTNTGCEYAGYWCIQRYGDILDNDDYFNKDKITYGTNWMNVSPNFFATLYRCTMKFPDERPNQTPRMGAGAMDRESLAGFYAAEERDKAVTMTPLFMKIVPKDYGLGDYKYPVWFRFLVVNESTVIWAEPLAYNPVIYRGYDAHEERELNASLVLEALPFQDHISNLITQQILTIKQNLLAVVFTNTDAVGTGSAEKLENLGQKLYTSVNFIPYSAKAAAFAGKDIKEAFIPVNFPRLDTTQIISGIRMLLDMMERILVMSSQEIGSAASHEQTAEETRVVATSTSNRLKYTAGFIDDADLAWKKQLYDALMAYGTDEIWAQTASVPEGDVKKALEDLGFSVEEEGDPAKNTKTLLKGDKTALMYEDFASTRDSTDRINNVALGNAMVQLMQVVITNPILFEAIGPVQAIAILNQIASLLGFFKDFHLEAQPVTSMTDQQKQEQQQQLMQVLKQFKDAMDKELQGAVAPIGQAVQQLTQQVQQIGQALQQIGPVAQQTAKAVPQLADQLKQVGAALPQIQQGMQQALQQVADKDRSQDATIQHLVSLLEQMHVASGMMAQPPETAPQQPQPPPPEMAGAPS